MTRLGYILVFVFVYLRIHWFLNGYTLDIATQSVFEISKLKFFHKTFNQGQHVYSAIKTHTCIFKMVGSCSAINYTAKKGSSVKSFYRFPLKNQDLLSKWVHAIKRKDWAPTEHSLLCSNHFDESCFVARPGKCGRRLYDHAVLTKFTFGKSYLDKPQTKRKPPKTGIFKNPQLKFCLHHQNVQELSRQIILYKQTYITFKTSFKDQ